MTENQSTENLNTLSDEELACKAQAGSRACFVVLIDRYSQTLMHFLSNRTHNRHDAEDLMQDTFIKAWLNIDKFRTSAKFSTWIFTIASRLAISHFRSGKNRNEQIPAKTTIAEPPEILIRREEVHNLWLMARTLPPDQHDALWLKYAQGMSVKDIARVMGKTSLYVRVLLHRGRSSLVKRIKENERQLDNQILTAKPPVIKHTNNIKKAEEKLVCSGNSI